MVSEKLKRREKGEKPLSLEMPMVALCNGAADIQLRFAPSIIQPNSFVCPHIVKCNRGPSGARLKEVIRKEVKEIKISEISLRRKRCPPLPIIADIRLRCFVPSPKFALSCEPSIFPIFRNCGRRM